jgi:hypothetical protein
VALQTVEDVGEPFEVLLGPVGCDVDVLRLIALSVALQRSVANDDEPHVPVT